MWLGSLVVRALDLLQLMAMSYCPAIWRFFNFSVWRPPQSWILKFSNFSTVETFNRVKLHHCQISLKSLQPQPRYRDFSIFQRWRPPPPWILKFQNFNGGDGQEGRSNYFTTPNFVEIGPNAAEISRFIDFSRWLRRHLGFSKFQIFNGGAVKRAELRHHAKFR